MSSAITLDSYSESLQTICAQSRLCPGGHAGALGAVVGGVMVKWTSGGSERTFNQSAASGRNEHNLSIF